MLVLKVAIGTVEVNSISALMIWNNWNYLANYLPSGPSNLVKAPEIGVVWGKDYHTRI